MTRYQWYVLQVRTGREREIADDLIRHGVEGLVPTEERLIRRGGKWHRVEYVLMSGYVFVRCRYTSTMYYMLRKIPGVQRWLTADGKPAPLYPDEEVRILYLGARTLTPSYVYRQPGGGYAILSGPLLDLRDNIREIDWHRRRARVVLPVLGENRSIWLSIDTTAAAAEKASQLAPG